MVLQAKCENWRGQMRIPEPIAAWVKNEARKNFRSMNAEFVELLKEAKERSEKNAGH